MFSLCLIAQVTKRGRLVGHHSAHTCNLLLSSALIPDKTPEKSEASFASVAESELKPGGAAAKHLNRVLFLFRRQQLLVTIEISINGYAQK